MLLKEEGRRARKVQLQYFFFFGGGGVPIKHLDNEFILTLSLTASWSV